MKEDRPIVLVEDNKIAREGLSRLFKANGFNALVVYSSAEAAIEEVRTMRPLAIVSDFNLGPIRMNGLQFLMFVTKYFPDVPKVLISGDDFVASLAAEVDCKFISKYDSDDLITFLQTVVK